MFKFLKEKIGGFFKKEEKEKPKEEKKVSSVKKEKKTKDSKISKGAAKKVEKSAVKTEKAIVQKAEESVELAEEKHYETDSSESIVQASSETKENKGFFGFFKKRGKGAEAIGEQTSEEKLKETAETIKEEIPMNFDSGKLKYEPDIEGIKEKLEEKEEKSGFFSRLAQRLTTSELKDDEFNEFFDEFEMTLLESNVALEVVDEFRKILHAELVGKRFKEKEVEGKIKDVLKKAIDEILIEGEDLIETINKKDGTFVILFFGINGSGKTTNISKLAFMLKQKGISCVLGAGDTFRAASIEQLENHASMLQVPIVKHNYQADPAAVAFDTVAYAKKNHIKVALIDTAGRMYTKTNLLQEMEKIVRVAKPDLKVFVGESITGNDATEQAKTFNESVGIDGIILSKADIDEKSGAILSVSFVTKKPILFLGVGQRYEDLKVFKKKDVMKGLGLE